MLCSLHGRGLLHRREKGEQSLPTHLSLMLLKQKPQGSELVKSPLPGRDAAEMSATEPKQDERGGCRRIGLFPNKS